MNLPQANQTHLFPSVSSTTESHTVIAPRFTDVRDQVKVTLNADPAAATFLDNELPKEHRPQSAVLGCAAQSHPPPTYAWYRRLKGGQLQPLGSLATLLQLHPTHPPNQLHSLVAAHHQPSAGASSSLADLDATTSASGGLQHTPSAHGGHPTHGSHAAHGALGSAAASAAVAGAKYVQLGGVLYVNRLSPQDAGVYVCAANNSLAEERAEIELQINGRCILSLLQKLF